MSTYLLSEFDLFDKELNTIPAGRLLITTLNAHSYNISRQDEFYAESLAKSDILLPDGISVVMAVRLLTGRKLHKIAGADLFFYEMNRLNLTGGSCFFLGSSEKTLNLIINRTSYEFPNVMTGKFSPPYKPVFTPEENKIMIESVNAFKPDVLFVGMTAPKQEKWAYEHLQSLNTGHVCCIGAVFDFYAGTVSRAPVWMINLGLEWLYRLVKEPSRMWRRYLIGNSKFVLSMITEIFRSKKQ
jgi:N-acetylglucosaminyldiphosphoundecaprenol N-acetyl-beta-D-mannosaminyltransferase